MLSAPRAGVHVLRRQGASASSLGFMLRRFGCSLCPSLVEHPIHMVLLILFATQVQEAASRGLKFVSVIPQYHCPVNSAGSSLPVGGGDKNNPGAPAGEDGSPEPNQGPGEETPITAKQPSLPLEEGDGADFSKTLEGPDGDLSEVPGEPLSGSKYVSTATIGLRGEKLTASQESPWHFMKKKWNENVERAIHQTGESLSSAFLGLWTVV